MSVLQNLRLSWAKALFGLVLPLCLAAQTWATDAHAGPRILLLEFGGRASDVLRDKVKQSLEEDGNTVVLAEQSAQGQSRSELARLAKNQRADVIVDGVARRQGMKSWLVSLRVLKAETGGSVGGWIRFKNSFMRSKRPPRSTAFVCRRCLWTTEAGMRVGRRSSSWPASMSGSAGCAFRRTRARPLR